jgi:D-psicose/D-tagatose/L-ribulose 3-epimerase
MDMAVPFFRKLADRAEAHDVIVCLEPNPPVYDCNFMTTTREAIAVVQAVDHPNIRLQIDTGAMITNQEDAAQVVAEAINWFGHIHLSEPNLAPLGESGSNHTAIANTLKLLVPEATATIEMRQAREGPNSLAAVSSALDYVCKHYSLVGHS